MKAKIFGTGLIIISLAALATTWFWGLHPYLDPPYPRDGIGPPSDGFIAWTCDLYPIHLIHPQWIHTQPFSKELFLTKDRHFRAPTRGEMWVYNPYWKWALIETWTRLILLFSIWFILIMFLFRGCFITPTAIQDKKVRSQYKKSCGRQFAIGLGLLGIPALAAAWFWGLHPGFYPPWPTKGFGPSLLYAENIGSGHVPEDPLSSILQDYPVHLVSPRWVRPQPLPSRFLPGKDGSTLVLSKEELWLYDLTWRWAILETLTRLMVLFFIWFASVMFLFARFTSHMPSPGKIPAS